MFECEEWRDVPGTDGRYRVSNLGNVESLVSWSRGGEKRLRDRPLRMTPSIAARGYRNLTSLVYANGGVKCKGVHVLVLEAFVGPRPSPSHQAAHCNGIAGDDRLENLAWKSPVQNARDKI